MQLAEFPKMKTLLAIALLLSCLSARADDLYFERLASAIRRAQGTWTYGVKTVKVRHEAEARAVCLRTIRHAWRDWDGRGSFVFFSADRYCPPSVDPIGNRNWRRNVEIIMRANE